MRNECKCGNECCCEKLFVKILYIEALMETIKLRADINSRKLYKILNDNFSHSAANEDVEKKPTLDVMDLVTFPGVEGRVTAINSLYGFTRNVQKLIIVDPYIFSGSANNATSIAAEFMSSLQSSVTHVHFIYDGGKVTNKIKKIILEKCSNRHIHVSVQATDAVHDRVWIADRREGIIVGTSFNGLGRKISFLVPLPPADFREFLNYLDTLGLSRA